MNTGYSSKEKLNALFEHWYAANEMKRIWFDTIPAGIESIESLEDASAVARRTILYMRLWYSCLFVVVEGYNELADAEVLARSEGVEELLADSEAIEGLRRLRNSTFHFQPTWGHAKFLGFYREADRGNWIRTLHKRLGAVAIQAEIDSQNHNEARLEQLNDLLAENKRSA